MSEYLDFWKLVAGLGLFLFAMRQLETALKQLSGKKFQRALGSTTNRPAKSVITGMVATTIVQSSSLVGLIVLAFLGAGIIPLVSAIGIVLGSNLGTTFTGWIVATLGFKVNLGVMVFPVIGFAGLGYGLARGRWKSLCLLLFSLSLLLMGLDFMKDSVSALSENADIERLQGYPLIVYLLVGVVLTAIVQSSSAVMMLTLSAVYAGVIPLPAAAALIIGADLGTTSTVILGSLQGAVVKRRLAAAQFLFNLIVDAFAFALLWPIINFIEFLRITDPLYALVAFHSLFNLFGILLFLPFIGKFAHLLETWIKDDKEQQQIKRYIGNVPANVTDAATEALAKETHRLLYLVMRLNMRFLKIDARKFKDAENQTKFSFPKRLLRANKQDYYLAIKKLEGEIINYAFEISAPDTHTDIDSKRLDNLMKTARSGVYSAKSLKDIDQNIMSIEAGDKALLKKHFKTLQTSATAFYHNIYPLLMKCDTHDLFPQKLASLGEETKQFHHEISKNFYKNLSSAHLTSLELSTALNVNKEMETSEITLIKALELFASSRACGQLGQGTGPSPNLGEC